MSRLLAAAAVFVVVTLAAAEKPWIGKWVSTDKPAENWDAFTKALGLSVEKFGGNQKSSITFSKEGDSYQGQMAVPAHNYISSWTFKIGEEGTHVEPKFNNTEIKYKFTEDGDKLLAEAKLPSSGKVIHDTYTVNGDELVKTYKVDDVVAKRWFKKEVSV